MTGLFDCLRVIRISPREFRRVLVMRMDKPSERYPILKPFRDNSIERECIRDVLILRCHSGGVKVERYHSTGRIGTQNSARFRTLQRAFYALVCVREYAVSISGALL